MNNRWSDAARLAALAVRKARAFAANPQDKGKDTPKMGGLAKKPSPMAYAGGSATFDESTGTRNNPGPHIWIPPNGGVGTQYEEGMKDLVAKKKLLAANTLPQPNIFYSSTGPQKPTAIAAMPPKTMPPKRPPISGGGEGVIETDTMRYIIGGKRYTKVGNKLVPDVTVPGEKVKNFYSK